MFLFNLMKSALFAILLLLCHICLAEDLPFNGVVYAYKAFVAVTGGETYFYLPPGKEYTAHYKEGLSIQQSTQSYSDYVASKKSEAEKFKTLPGYGFGIYKRPAPATNFVEWEYNSNGLLTYHLSKVVEKGDSIIIYEFLTDIKLPEPLVSSKFRKETWSSMDKLNILPFGKVAINSAPTVVEKINVPLPDKELVEKDPARLKALSDKTKKESAEATPVYLYSLSAALFNAGLKEEAMFWYYAGNSRKLVNEGILSKGVVKVDDKKARAEIELAARLAPAVKALELCNQERYLRALESAIIWGNTNFQSNAAARLKKLPPEESKKKMEALASRGRSYFKNLKMKYQSAEQVKIRETEKAKLKLTPQFCS